MFVGHEKQIDIFKTASANGRLMHAYIFSGLNGIGKKLFAVNVAKSLLCEKGSFFTSCDCDSCKAIDSGSHPDFHLYEDKKISDGKIINSDKVINVENVRKIIETAGMTPLKGKWNTFIIDDAHLLSDSAQGAPAANAILKTLEEPASNTIFFLITDKYEAILPTIRSRAVRVSFSPLNSSQVKEIVSNIDRSISYVDSAAAIGNGSVSKTLAVLREHFADAVGPLKDGNYVGFAETVLKLKNPEEVKTVVESVYPYVLEKFKLTGNPSVCELGYYLMDILKRFNYNGNVDLIKADFISKVVEVFSEAV